MNNLYERAGEFWKAKSNALKNRPWSVRLNNGELGLTHYKGFLLETYHNAGMNPQLQAYSTIFFKEINRDMVKKFYQHSISEIGHDLLAQSDLEALGVSENLVVNSQPLPTTRAFFANTYYQIQNHGVTAYLAYLFHLEFSPVTNGPAIMQMLKGKGIPDQALTFLHEHSTIDIQHLKLMKAYLENLIHDEKQEQIFFSCLSDNIILHNLMLEAAFENGEALFANRISSAVS